MGHIDERYDRDKTLLGNGTYATVYSATCKRTGERVALKKLRLPVLPPSTTGPKTTGRGAPLWPPAAGGSAAASRGLTGAGAPAGMGPSHARLPLATSPFFPLPSTQPAGPSAGGMRLLGGGAAGAVGPGGSVPSGAVTGVVAAGPELQPQPQPVAVGAVGAVTGAPATAAGGAGGEDEGGVLAGAHLDDRGGLGQATLREIKVLQELRHPHIVRLRETVPHKGTLVLVFDFAAGGDLEQLLYPGGRTGGSGPTGMTAAGGGGGGGGAAGAGDLGQSSGGCVGGGGGGHFTVSGGGGGVSSVGGNTILRPGDVKAHMKALLEALAYCHEQGVLHRDVKPNNLLLDGQGRLLLADFGLARYLPREAAGEEAEDLYGGGEREVDGGQSSGSQQWRTAPGAHETAAVGSGHGVGGAEGVVGTTTAASTHDAAGAAPVAASGSGVAEGLVDEAGLEAGAGAEGTSTRGDMTAGAAAAAAGVDAGSRGAAKAAATGGVLLGTCGTAAAGLGSEVGGSSGGGRGGRGRPPTIAWGDLDPYARPLMTYQIGMRWYRAPELLFGCRTYGTAVDMWATGCVFAEMMLGRVWFKGTSDVDQLVLIFRVLGTPDETCWPGVTKLPDYLQLTQMQPQDLATLFPDAAPHAVDLLAQLTHLCPAQRPTARQALAHPYFTADPPPTPPGELPLAPPRAAAAPNVGALFWRGGELSPLKDLNRGGPIGAPGAAMMGGGGAAAWSRGHATRGARPGGGGGAGGAVRGGRRYLPTPPSPLPFNFAGCGEAGAGGGEEGHAGPEREHGRLGVSGMPGRPGGQGSMLLPRLVLPGAATADRLPQLRPPLGGRLSLDDVRTREGLEARGGLAAGGGTGGVGTVAVNGLSSGGGGGSIAFPGRGWDPRGIQDRSFELKSQLNAAETHQGLSHRQLSSCMPSFLLSLPSGGPLPGLLSSLGTSAANDVAAAVAAACGGGSGGGGSMGGMSNALATAPRPGGAGARFSLDAGELAAGVRQGHEVRPVPMSCLAGGKQQRDAAAAAARWSGWHKAPHHHQARWESEERNETAAAAEGTTAAVAASAPRRWRQARRSRSSAAADMSVSAAVYGKAEDGEEGLRSTADGGRGEDEAEEEAAAAEEEEGEGRRGLSDGEDGGEGKLEEDEEFVYEDEGEEEDSRPYVVRRFSFGSSLVTDGDPAVAAAVAAAHGGSAGDGQATEASGGGHANSDETAGHRHSAGTAAAATGPAGGAITARDSVAPMAITATTWGAGAAICEDPMSISVCNVSMGGGVGGAMGSLGPEAGLGTVGSKRPRAVRYSDGMGTGPLLQPHQALPFQRHAYGSPGAGWGPASILKTGSRGLRGAMAGSGGGGGVLGALQLQPAGTEFEGVSRGGDVSMREGSTGSGGGSRGDGNGAAQTARAAVMTAAAATAAPSMSMMSGMTAPAASVTAAVHGGLGRSDSDGLLTDQEPPSYETATGAGAGGGGGGDECATCTTGMMMPPPTATTAPMATAAAPGRKGGSYHWPSRGRPSDVTVAMSLSFAGGVEGAHAQAACSVAAALVPLPPPSVTGPRIRPRAAMSGEVPANDTRNGASGELGGGGEGGSTEEAAAAAVDGDGGGGAHQQGAAALTGLPLLSGPAVPGTSAASADVGMVAAAAAGGGGGFGSQLMGRGAGGAATAALSGSVHLRGGSSGQLRPAMPSPDLQYLRQRKAEVDEALWQASQSQGAPSPSPPSPHGAERLAYQQQEQRQQQNAHPEEREQQQETE